MYNIYSEDFIRVNMIFHRVLYVVTIYVNNIYIFYLFNL